jgi:hypothetical protein
VLSLIFGLGWACPDLAIMQMQIKMVEIKQFHRFIAHFLHS